MAHEAENRVKSEAEYEYSRRKRAAEMRSHLSSFAMMIFLTLIAFTAVAAGYSGYLVVPIILLLAAIQVALQLYYFMHMKEKGHGMAAFFIYGGVLIAMITVLTFLTIVWI